MTLSTVTRFSSGYRLRTGEEMNQKGVDPINLLNTQTNTSATNITTLQSQTATLTAGTFPRTVTDGVTAAAGGGQTNATQLAGTAANVTTVASAADSVKLPAGIAGRFFFLENVTATSMQVFGNGTDTINAVATATGVAQAAGKSAVYFCTTNQPAAKWFRVLSA